MSLSVEISHSFNGFKLDVEFAAGPGVTALTGPSGAGKSTVLNAIAGLITPDRGSIALNGVEFLNRGAGVNLAANRRQVGYVFQDGRLFPHLSVRKNLTFSQRVGRKTSRDTDLEHMSELLGITRLLDRRPNDLSGGERQRVAIGRALLSNPGILLMDEPLASLDEARKSEIFPYIKRLVAGTSIPILYVSHSVQEIKRLTDRVIYLRSGKIVETANPFENFVITDSKDRAHTLNLDPGKLVLLRADNLVSSKPAVKAIVTGADTLEIAGTALAGPEIAIKLKALKARTSETLWALLPD